jgi:hypothetical protein
VIGHLTDRKNPVAAADAFTTLIEEHGPRQFDAELHIKFVDRANPVLTGRAGRPEQDRDALVAEPSRVYPREVRGRERVTVHIGTCSRSALLRLYGDNARRPVRHRGKACRRTGRTRHHRRFMSRT